MRLGPPWTPSNVSCWRCWFRYNIQLQQAGARPPVPTTGRRRPQTRRRWSESTQQIVDETTFGGASMMKLVVGSRRRCNSHSYRVSKERPAAFGWERFHSPNHSSGRKEHHHDHPRNRQHRGYWISSRGQSRRERCRGSRPDVLARKGKIPARRTPVKADLMDKSVGRRRKNWDTDYPYSAAPFQRCRSARTARGSDRPR